MELWVSILDGEQNKRELMPKPLGPHSPFSPIVRGTHKMIFITNVKNFQKWNPHSPTRRVRCPADQTLDLPLYLQRCSQKITWPGAGNACFTLSASCPCVNRWVLRPERRRIANRRVSPCTRNGTLETSAVYRCLCLVHTVCGLSILENCPISIVVDF